MRPPQCSYSGRWKIDHFFVKWCWSDWFLINHSSYDLTLVQSIKPLCNLSSRRPSWWAALSTQHKDTNSIKFANLLRIFDKKNPANIRIFQPRRCSVVDSASDSKPREPGFEPRRRHPTRSFYLLSIWNPTKCVGWKYWKIMTIHG